MKSETVLVITRPGQSKLTEEFVRAGFRPVVKDRMHDALDAIQHRQFAGVFVDAARVNLDVLELVLNRNDIEPGLPVVVTGCSVEPGEAGAALLCMPNVHLVGRVRGAAESVARFRAIVSSSRSPAVAGRTPDRRESAEGNTSIQER